MGLKRKISHIYSDPVFKIVGSRVQFTQFFPVLWVLIFRLMIVFLLIDSSFRPLKREQLVKTGALSHWPWSSLRALLIANK